MRQIRLIQTLVELVPGAIASLNGYVKQHCARFLERGVGMKPELVARSITALLMLGLLTGVGQGATAIAADAASGSLAKPAIANANQIPPEIVSTLRQDLSKRTGIPANQLRFVAVSSQTWSDGCLGLARPGEICTQALVNGWRVTFAHGNQRWVYRTNGSGSSFRLEPTKAASQFPTERDVSAIQPAQIPAAELPSRLQKDVVFRAIASGGFTGRTFQTTLYRDGKLVREQVSFNNTPGVTTTRQVSPQQVRQFIALLQQNRLHRLNRADFQPAPGSADFITTTLSCPTCTVRYADSIQAQLPANLQTVIQAWNDLTRTI